MKELERQTVRKDLAVLVTKFKKAVEWNGPDASAAWTYVDIRAVSTPAADSPALPN